MTTTWHYDVGLVLDRDGNPLGDSSGQFRLKTDNGPGAVAQATDTNGDPLDAIRTSSYGIFSRFNVTAGDDDAIGYLDFGDVMQPVASVEAMNSLPEARAALAAAQSAQAAAQAAAAAAATSAAAAQAAAASSGTGGGYGTGYGTGLSDDVIDGGGLDETTITESFDGGTI